MKNALQTHYVTCSCLSPEHTLRFMYDPDYPEFYTEVYLNQHRSFLKRALVAIRYLFGYTSKYGDWDCTNMEKEEAKELSDFILLGIKDIENKAALVAKAQETLNNL